MRHMILALIAAPLLLSACDGPKDQDGDDNVLLNQMIENESSNAVINAAAAETKPSISIKPSNAVAAPHKAPEVSDHQQLQDDAEAAGLTTRAGSGSNVASLNP